MNITIIVDEILSKTEAGVYKIEFSNGFFYIGCSRNLKSRIAQHKSAINSNFSTKYTAVPLKKMVGFKGTVTISLLEAIDLSQYTRWDVRAVLEGSEKAHIVANNRNKKLLNIIVRNVRMVHYGQPYRWTKRLA